jgi:hypothetical protein
MRKSVTINPWKTAWNVLAALVLFLSSLWMLRDDYRYPGEILFSMESGGMAWLLLFLILWFFLSHLFAIFPKRLLFPCLFLALSRIAIGFPLNLWMPNNLACIIVSGALTLIMGLYFVGSVFHFLKLEQRNWFQIKHSLVVLGFGVTMAVASIPFGLTGFLASAKNFLGDYTRVSLSSISLLERVFTRGGKKVFLIGMMHIGDAEFFSTLDARMREEFNGKRVILTEGVSDKKQILPTDFKSGQTYGKWARKFGLKVQNSGESTSSPSQSDAQSQILANRGIAFLNADIDVSELSEEHQKLLVTILETLNSNDLATLIKGPEGVDGASLEDLMMEGLIKFRNDRLMSFFDETFALGVDEIYIPWGAAHLPDIEKRLLSQGFEKISEETRPVVRFWNR